MTPDQQNFSDPNPLITFLADVGPCRDGLVVRDLIDAGFGDDEISRITGKPIEGALLDEVECSRAASGFEAAMQLGSVELPFAAFQREGFGHV